MDIERDNSIAITQIIIIIIKHSIEKTSLDDILLSSNCSFGKIVITFHFLPKYSGKLTDDIKYESLL